LTEWSGGPASGLAGHTQWGLLGRMMGETWVGMGIEIDFGTWQKKMKMKYSFKFSNHIYKIQTYWNSKRI
jgi:hypothetical protein